jgi:hypothetical protein
MVNYDVTTKCGMRERAELFVQQLHTFRYAQLSYDACEQCGSLWLDAGELDKLIFKDVAAAFEALANTYIYDHPALFWLFTGDAQSGRNVGM